ncbi:MAG: flagellar basal body-associated FliL family protein [Parvularculaceae bacterium]|nr:flagellar basal body-associated FliL family protein [Parvularculaceae bacterium]
MKTISVLAGAALVGAAAGIGARVVLSPPAQAAQSEEDSESATADAHGAKAQDSGHGAGKRGDKGGGHGAAPATAFIEFSRQFIAPAIENGRPVGLMILDINLEVENAVSSLAYSQEPKLRDAVLRTLLRLGSEDSLADLMTNTEKLERVRAAILDECQEVLGDGVLAVLIMDVGYQRY